MIYVFSGDNDFTLKAALRSHRDSFVSEHGPDSFTAREGGDITTADLPQLLAGASLFSPARLTIITAASVNKSVWELLPDSLSEDGAELILVEQKPDKRTRTYKWLQKNATIRQFDAPSERDLQQWIETTARQHQINISPEIARFLIGYAGPDQWRLHQELQKLALAKRPITQELIRDVVDPNPQASVFELLDAAIAGKRDHVQDMIAVIARVEDPYKFVGLLTSQMYALALVHAAGDRPAAIIARDAGLHPYVTSKTQASARQLSSERLHMMIETIAELDRKLKSSGGDPWLLIGAALIKIAA